jgi:hypothetical protein
VLALALGIRGLAEMAMQLCALAAQRLPPHHQHVSLMLRDYCCVLLGLGWRCYLGIRGLAKMAMHQMAMQLCALAAKRLPPHHQHVGFMLRD